MLQIELSVLFCVVNLDDGFAFALFLPLLMRIESFKVLRLVPALLLSLTSAQVTAFDSQLELFARNANATPDSFAVCPTASDQLEPVLVDDRNTFLVLSRGSPFGILIEIKALHVGVNVG
jgi:hypothetical protein